MPKVYSDQRKQEIREELLEAGLIYIKKYGFKGMSIELLTKKVGIAQGTFYHFFTSKEEIVVRLMEQYQKYCYVKIEEKVAETGFLVRFDLKKIYQEMMLRDESNVLRYLSREDVQVLMNRLPKELKMNINTAESFIQEYMKYIKHKKNEIDIATIINWVQVINITLENEDLLIGNQKETIINRLIDNMLDEIFQP